MRKTSFCDFCGEPFQDEKAVDLHYVETTEAQYIETTEPLYTCPLCRDRLAALDEKDRLAAEYFTALLKSGVTLKHAYLVLAKHQFFISVMPALVITLQAVPALRPDGKKGVRVSYSRIKNKGLLS
ncbi:MAG: hypothetical protein LBT20_07205 [Clostridiales bacterium]|jgi:hypothetical protein|nr:hypothetical protein [Clostridiales bacterium]